jgi:hypothetical protein
MLLKSTSSQKKEHMGEFETEEIERDLLETLKCVINQFGRTTAIEYDTVDCLIMTSRSVMQNLHSNNDIRLLLASVGKHFKKKSNPYLKSWSEAFFSYF